MLSTEQWRVTIIKVRPRLLMLGVFLLGLVIGLVWAYGIAPTVWTNAEPVHLDDSYKAEWVKMVADQYAWTADRTQAERLLALVGDAVGIIDRLTTENAGDSALVGRLNAIRPFAEAVGADASNPVLAKTQVSGLQALNPVILVVVIAIVGVILIIFWGMYGLALRMIIGGLLPSRRRKTAETDSISSTSSIEAERRRIQEEVAQQREAEAVSQQSAGLPPPIARFMSAYIAGDDYYDDSFSIEDESGGFLGETGAGISETIGVGQPKKVTAIEVWLFDKNDIRTVTKVLMSEHAYNDEALRAKLAPKGEAVLAQPGAQIELETQTLRVIATIRDMAYGTGPLPPNSYFERLTLDIAAYTKEGATSAPGTAIGDMYGGSGSLPSA